MNQNKFEKKILELHTEFAQSSFNSVSDFFESIRDKTALREIKNACLIKDSGEPLVEIPQVLRLPTLHPYQAAGAPYGNLSPWFVRESILEKLRKIQEQLDEDKPGFALAVYDAYRPVAVQKFMIALERNRLAKNYGASDFASLTNDLQAEVKRMVYSIWARASSNMQCPAPHSTGSVVDLTIVDEAKKQLPMGSKIDAYPPTSLPSFYRHSKLIEERHFHENRRLLQTLMATQGFCRLAHEWWHFSFGDQQWALQEIIRTGDTSIVAHFGSCPQQNYVP